jgi:hypothetical protein
MARLKIAPLARKKRVVTSMQVKQMISSRLEHKIYTDSEIGTFATTGLVVPVFIPADADTYADRTGLVVRPSALTVRLNFINASSSTFNTGRLIVFQDRHARGAAPSVADVLFTAAYNSCYNAVNILNGRFKILKDRTIDFGVGASPNWGGTPSGSYDVVIPMKGTVSFITENANVGSVGENAIFALFIANNTGATYNVQFQVKFTDA